MFGWELPPYNSGGLGTACLGLTEGLTSLGLSVDFVVPKVFGQYPFSHMRILSAADYSSSSHIKALLALNDTQQALIAQSLGYGNRLTLDEKKRLLVQHLHQQIPVAPHIQATWYAQQAASIAAKTKFDVVHCHDWMTYYCGTAAQKVASNRGETTPVVAHVHATEIDRSGAAGDPAIIDIEKKGLQAADRVVTVSHYTKQVVHNHYDVPLSKISVVHNGIPTQREPERFDLHELKKHFKLVLFMGRITMQKGPDYFIKLAKAVTDRDPTVKFIMVGSGDMEKRCIEEAARLGLTGKILFSTFLRGKDVDRAYQLADLFVMPSVSEPFGIVALEALQNGTPALVSKQSGVIEVCPHLVQVDFWDIDAMRNAVLDTLYNPGYTAAVREYAKHDLPKLSWHNSAERMREVYEDVLAAAQPAPLFHLQPAFAPA
ncbi:glycosyltransferase family 4 protein [Patescibacteria group bacterium]|nr:glycosyltransferase family 4 protein [Patescibacteria group bacterium]